MGIRINDADRSFAHCGTNLVGRLGLQFLEDLLRLLLGRERSTHIGCGVHRVRNCLEISTKGYKQNVKLVVALWFLAVQSMIRRRKDRCAGSRLK